MSKLKKIMMVLGIKAFSPPSIVVQQEGLTSELQNVGKLLNCGFDKHKVHI